MRRIALSSRLRLAIRTSLGFAGLGVGSSVCGAGVVGLLLLLQGIPREVGGRTGILIIAASSYVALTLLIGTAWTTWLHRKTLIWFVLGRAPTAEEASRALRMPVDLALISATLWLSGTVVIGGLAGILGAMQDALGVGLTVGLGGLTTVGLTYLAAEWVARPVMSRALEVNPPRGALSVTVLRRLVLAWALTSGVPLLGVLLVAAPPHLDTGDQTGSLSVLSATGIVVGALGTGLLARAVAAPLHRLRLALDRVAKGHTDVRVPVDDTSEIGMLQTSVNDMVTGLREQERMRDLFGRHVGTDVARHALEFGASLSGDVREATALFVDIVDSTALAYELPPDEFVRKLNRLFASVVDAVDTHEGLVNKFQGDAALCVFGAPTRLANSATSALRAARTIRDDVRATGELDLGIGLACGPVFAGQLGTSSRLEYTVIGDAVNEAARLTESAKQVPGRILASESVIEASADGERARWRKSDTISLRGREQSTVAWADV